MKDSYRSNCSKFTCRKCSCKKDASSDIIEDEEEEISFSESGSDVEEFANIDELLESSDDDDIILDDIQN